MRTFLRGIAILIGVAGILAVGFGVYSKFSSPTSVQTEVIEVPDETSPSNGGLISQDPVSNDAEKPIAP